MYRSYRVKEQVKLLQKYIPTLEVSDIEPNLYSAGIRAQALDENGKTR
jgi:L-2-hydroxyglutarate oxidase LhgO